LGDVDESIRQLTPVLQSHQDNALAQCMLAQAQFRKDLYAAAAASAARAVSLSPAYPEPHFWLAEALRMGAVSGKDPERDYNRARAEYVEYLRRSDFDSKLAGKLNYYVRGFLIGKGRKSR